MKDRDAIEQLAALLDGETTAEDAPAALANLATLARTVQEHSELVAPTAGFRAQLRADLISAAAPQPTLTERMRTAWDERTASWRNSARVAAATMTASSMLGSAGVAMAAQEALPGEFLHPVKDATEAVRLWLATDDIAEARLLLSFASERLEELERGAADLTADEVVETLDRMDEASRAGAELLIDRVQSGDVSLAEITAFTDRQRSALTQILSDLPLPARPAAEDSLELLRRIDVNGAAAEASAIACQLCEDAARATRAPGAAVRAGETLIAMPGEGAALVDDQCDCVDLPGGEDFREPVIDGGDDDTLDVDGTTDDGDGTTDDGDGTTDDGGSLSDPTTDRDSTDGDTTLDESVVVDEQLNGEDLVDDTVEDVTDGLRGPTDTSTSGSGGTGTVTTPLDEVADVVDDSVDAIVP